MSTFIAEHILPALRFLAAAWGAFGIISFVVVILLQRRAAAQHRPKAVAGRPEIEVVHDGSSYPTGFIIIVMMGPIPLVLAILDARRARRQPIPQARPADKEDQY